jgi:hypothetical protein
MNASELCLKTLLQEKSMDCSNLVAQCVEIVNLIDSKCATQTSQTPPSPITEHSDFSPTPD